MFYLLCPRFFTLLYFHYMFYAHATPRPHTHNAHTHNADTHNAHTHNAHTHTTPTQRHATTYASFSMVSRALFKPTSYSLPDDESITNLTLSLAATVNR